MALSKIKVLIVDDSILFRTTLERGLATDMNIQIVGTAVDPVDAMGKIQALSPDVVTLDVEMPKMNGIDFLKKLMPEHPLPVVVVSSLPINALDALDAGAVDFVKKPDMRSPRDLNDFINELTIKVKIASTARVGKKFASVQPFAATAAMSTLSAGSNTNIVIAIGASTGGTEAILEVLRNLPATAPGIVVVQHMPPIFTNMYAQRLDKICKMRVKEAQDGDRVERGRVLIAAGDAHMRLARDSRGYLVKCASGPKVSGHCPSVDVLFESVSLVAPKNALGIILTGMGADGARGMLQMHQKGAYTIGQDKESCVVYGMPMVAYSMGGVDRQLPLDQISGEIIRYLNTMKRL